MIDFYSELFYCSDDDEWMSSDFEETPDSTPMQSPELNSIPASLSPLMVKEFASKIVRERVSALPTSSRRDKISSNITSRVVVRKVDDRDVVRRGGKDKVQKARGGPSTSSYIYDGDVDRDNSPSLVAIGHR